MKIDKSQQMVISYFFLHKICYIFETPILIHTEIITFCVKKLNELTGKLKF